MPRTKQPAWLVVAATLALVWQPAETALSSNNMDPRLLRNVERAITLYAFFTVFDDVRVDIDDEGIVVLSGDVTALAKRTAIAKRVAAVDGVVGVRNDLDVLPVSHRDTQLRYQVARAIYGSSTFWRYASRRNPPIHVVVKGGHVTLTGSVDNETERGMVSVIASQFPPASLTNELRLTEVVRPGRASLD